MAHAENIKKVPSNLNKLLEDALDDLLLDDNSDNETKGRPNIEESLRKISEVNKAQNSWLDEGDSIKSNVSLKGKVTKQNQPEASTSDGPHPVASKVLDEEMNRFFANMTEKLKDMPKIDPEEAQAKINESVPQILDLMQNLLSRELLYPALKDLVPKFDEYLQKNQATLSKEDKRRYKQQIGKIHKMIDVFDDESIGDQERFEKNLQLMEQMQALGAPPEELTVPDGMNRCSIM